MDDATDIDSSLAICEMLVEPSGIPTLKVGGELDIASVGPIRLALDRIVAEGPKRVVIDLSGLRFIDSSGLSVLLAVASQLSEVELRDPTPIVRKVIGLTGLSDIFVITPELPTTAATNLPNPD